MPEGITMSVMFGQRVIGYPGQTCRNWSRVSESIDVNFSLIIMLFMRCFTDSKLSAGVFQALAIVSLVATKRCI